MDLSQFDDDTALLIIRLQLEDAEVMKASLGKGKHREGEIADLQVSVDLLQADLDALQQRLNNRVMSRSMALARETDARVIQEAEDEEQQEASDNRMALDLTESPDNLDNNPPEQSTALVLEVQSTNSTASSSRPCSSMSGQPASSKQGANRPPEPQATSACVACSDQFRVFDLMSAPCSHSYCIPCARELFASSIGDETLFPPRCCGQTIPIDSNIAILGSELAQSCQEKKIEYETTNRTYCHVTSCSAFIPPSQIQESSATCPKCNAVTCSSCKAAYHMGNCAARDDPGLQQVLDLAKMQGWQQCKKCSRVVELGHGCYHMTCHCKAEFCYLCNADWKTCECVQWDNEHLIDRAEQVVDRQQNRPLNPQQRAAAVAQQTRRLIDNHNCIHRTWNYRYGRGQCDECHDTMPNYTFVCSQCQLMACNRCRLNRL